MFDAASQALRVENLDAHFLQVRRAVGPPWNNDHKLAMAAAIVAEKAFFGGYPIPQAILITKGLQRN